MTDTNEGSSQDDNSSVKVAVRWVKQLLFSLHFVVLMMLPDELCVFMPRRSNVLDSLSSLTLHICGGENRWSPTVICGSCTSLSFCSHFFHL